MCQITLDAFSFVTDLKLSSCFLLLHADLSFTITSLRVQISPHIPVSAGGFFLSSPFFFLHCYQRLLDGELFGFSLLCCTALTSECEVSYGDCVCEYLFIHL